LVVECKRQGGGGADRRERVSGAGERSWRSFPVLNRSTCPGADPARISEEIEADHRPRTAVKRHRLFRARPGLGVGSHPAGGWWIGGRPPADRAPLGRLSASDSSDSYTTPTADRDRVLRVISGRGFARKDKVLLDGQQKYQLTKLERRWG